MDYSRKLRNTSRPHTVHSTYRIGKTSNFRFRDDRAAARGAERRRSARLRRSVRLSRSLVRPVLPPRLLPQTLPTP